MPMSTSLMGCGASKTTHVLNAGHPVETEREKIDNDSNESRLNTTISEQLRLRPLPDIVPKSSPSSQNLYKVIMEESTSFHVPEYETRTSVDISTEAAPKKEKKVDKFAYVLEDPVENVKREIRDRLNGLIGLEEYRSNRCSADLEFLTACTRAKQAVQRPRKDILVDEMVKSNCFTVFRKVFEHNFDDQMFNPENPQAYTNMKYALISLWNGTDSSLPLIQELQKAGYFKTIVQYLDHPMIAPQDLEGIKPVYLAKGFLGIIHNGLQKCDIREALRSADAVRITSKFRDSKNLMLKCKAEFNLSYLLTEEENAQLNSNAENIKFIGNILSSTLKGEDHYSKRFGYRTGEVISALNKLAANDDNKIKLVEEGLLKHFVTLLNPDTSSENEQILAARGLWILSFKVKDDIIRADGCIEGLKKLSTKGKTKDVQDAAKGALWILEGKDEASLKEAVEEMQANENACVGKGHVMISYQWDTKPMLLNVRDKLRGAGHSVWMDVDNMSGSILEAMADAVEQASVVVICLSQKYKESPNCRTEAEYAYRLQKKIVPLLLQTRYRPDGWLGAIAGNRLYFDLSQDRKYQASIDNLLIELNRLAGGDQIQKTTQESLMSRPLVSQSASNWSESKVADWLQEQGISNQIKAFSGMDGSLLLEFKSMYHHAPEFFYTSLKDQMRFSLLDILKFTKAVKALS